MGDENHHITLKVKYVFIGILYSEFPPVRKCIILDLKRDVGDDDIQPYLSLSWWKNGGLDESVIP